MHWTLAVLFMILSSVVAYLFVRKSTLLCTPTPLNNLAMFGIPFIVYVIAAVVTKTSLVVTPFQFFVIILISIFFAYFGNVFSLKSIEYAPNPGYSLILSKSYVVMTTILSIFVFQQELTIQKAIAIIIIIGFSALVMITKKSSENEKQHIKWLPLSLGAFFCWGMLAMMTKYLLSIGVLVLPRLIYTMIIVSGLILLDIRREKIDVRSITAMQKLVLLIVGIFMASFNWFTLYAYEIAPNFGYVNAANAASIAGVSLLSTLFFKDELTKQKLIGIIGVTAGLVLLLV